LGDRSGLGQVFRLFDALMYYAKGFLHCPGCFLAVRAFKPDSVYGNVSTWRHDDFNGSVHFMDFDVPVVAKKRTTGFGLIEIDTSTVDCFTEDAALNEYVAGDCVFVLVFEILPMLWVFRFHNVNTPAKGRLIERHFVIAVVVQDQVQSVNGSFMPIFHCGGAFAFGWGFNQVNPVITASLKGAAEQVFEALNLDAVEFHWMFLVTERRTRSNWNSV